MRFNAFLSDPIFFKSIGLLLLVHFVVPLTESLDSTFYSIKVNELTKAELPVDSFMAF